MVGKFKYCPPLILEDLNAETLSTGERTYTLPNGSKVPSITTILSWHKREVMAEWRKKVGEVEANRITTTACNRGTAVHALCEKYLNNDPLFNQDTNPAAMTMFRSLVPKLNNINNIHYQECALYSNKLGVAGRVDVIAEYKGVLSVIDFKTSSKLKKAEWLTDYYIQETFYALAYEELVGVPIDQIVTLMAVDNHPAQIYIEKTENWISALVDKIRIYDNYIPF